MSGTVNVSRSLWEDEAFKPELFTEREAWVWMIMEASWKPRTRRVGDYIVPTERGQLAASVRFMAKAWGWTPSKTNRFLKRLEGLGKIIAKTETGVSVVTICKYSDYQSPTKGSGTPAKQERNRSETKEKKDARRMQENSSYEEYASEAYALFRAAAKRAGWSIPQVKPGADRRKAIIARLKECDGLAGWRHALSCAEASSFINKGSWFGLDWMIKPANFRKIMEGKYVDRNQSQHSAGGGNARAGGTHDSLLNGFASIEDHPQSGRQSMGAGDGFGVGSPGDTSMDCGPSGDDTGTVLYIADAR